MTVRGGSLMTPEVLDAMNEASTCFVDMEELNLAAGKVVARACGAEAGLVTASCAASQVLMVAACMTGKDERKIDLLPSSSLGKNEVFRFSNDNIFARFHENIRHRDVFLVQPFAAPVNDHRTKLTAQKEMRQQSYQ